MRQGPTLFALFVCLAPKVAEDARLQILLVLVAARELGRPLDPTVAPPCVGIAAPLRMQCAHSCEGAPQRRTGTGVDNVLVGSKVRYSWTCPRNPCLNSATAYGASRPLLRVPAEGRLT